MTQIPKYIAEANQFTTSTLLPKVTAALEGSGFTARVSEERVSEYSYIIIEKDGEWRGMVTFGLKHAHLAQVRYHENNIGFNEQGISRYEVNLPYGQSNLNSKPENLDELLKRTRSRLLNPKAKVSNAKPPKFYFFGRVEVRDGENEYITPNVVIAETLDAAGDKIVAANTYDDYRETKLNGVQQITREDFNVLSKYL